MSKIIGSDGLVRRGKQRGFCRSRLTAQFGVMIVSCLLAGCSCSSDNKVADDDEVLLIVDGKELVLQDVISRIPVGIEPADSAALFDKIVSNWIETAVLAELAESKLPDLEEINQKVEAYRNRLIVTEYLGRMKESQRTRVSSDSVRAYYEAHRKDLLTESPLVKGVYIKVPSSVSGIETIRNLIFRSAEEDIDRLEKDWMDMALQYDYFGSTWVDWQTLAEQIPYRFYDPDAFLESTNNFETSYNGSTYFFHISEYLPTGSEQPYEFAAGKISSILEQSKIASFEDALVASLVEKAIKENRIVAVGYDPVRKMFQHTTSHKINKDTK